MPSWQMGSLAAASFELGAVPPLHCVALYLMFLLKIAAPFVRVGRVIAIRITRPLLIEFLFQINAPA